MPTPPAKPLSFFVHGKPKADPRIRCSCVGGKFARVYKPATANEWKRAIRTALGESDWDGKLITGPVIVDLNFQFVRPQRLNRKKDADTRLPHVIKPDIDNLEKAVLDALTEKKLWKDDCQVFGGSTYKHYVSRTGSFREEGCGIKIVQI
mgnify:CR=1 FL=1